MNKKGKYHKDSMTFPLETSLYYSDLEQLGYDISKVTDKDMEEIANDVLEHLCKDFSSTLDYVAQRRNIKRNGK